MTQRKVSLGYFSYSEPFIKIEISVIVTPDYMLVNNDWRKLNEPEIIGENKLLLFSAGKQSKIILLASEK